MQNEKRLGVINFKTRLVGPGKNGRLMRRAPVFENAAKLLCAKLYQKEIQNENGKRISYLKFLDDIILEKRWLHAIRRDKGKAFRVNKTRTSVLVILSPRT